MIVSKTIKYVPGLYKIFDEILVNARDQSVKDRTCRKIKIDIDQQTGRITCWNNGENGMPVEFHNVDKCYVPELLFFKIRTSENYEEKDKVVGGKNGIGAKAANIFSVNFDVTVVDNKNKKMYQQSFSNNMYEKSEPKITNITKKCESSLEISFIPDYKRFGVDGLSDDVVGAAIKTGEN